MKHTSVLLIGFTAMILTMAGCKDDDSKSSGGGDLKAVAESISSPTGSVESADVAQGVGEAFAEKLANSDMVPAGESATVECTAGGSVTASGDSAGNNVTFNYNNCCEMANCCIDGPGWMSQNVDGFLLCMSFDVTFDCEEVTGSYDMEYCQGEDGAAWYLVEFEGDTYACTGYYDSETGGSWTIRDANGEWECQASCSGDTCTGSCTDGTNTYEW
ncbi:MAG: hypothetical protein JXR76_22305 [Deltaproteobacteria bacterium]|nr:hypothetical protein [Deltaproteobacteria bacterium]